LFLNQPLGNQIKNVLNSFALTEREKIGSENFFFLRFSAETSALPTTGWCVTLKMPGL